MLATLGTMTTSTLNMMLTIVVGLAMCYIIYCLYFGTCFISIPLGSTGLLMYVEGMFKLPKGHLNLISKSALCET